MEPTVVDSQGRRWIGDPGPGLDTLNIRPDVNGGFNAIPAWCVPSDDGLAALGFDGADPNDVALLGSIRWDLGAEAPSYILQIPLEGGAGVYDLDLYFGECCCPQRHFSIFVQGEMRVMDVSNPIGLPGLVEIPGVFVLDDGVLEIELVACSDPDCPGGTDPNPILSASEIRFVSELPDNNSPNAVATADPADPVQIVGGSAEVDAGRVRVGRRGRRYPRARLPLGEDRRSGSRRYDRGPRRRRPPW